MIGDEPRRDLLSERHLALFGAIVQWFARYELTLQQVMAKVAATEPGSIAVLTRRLDFSEKRAALLALLRERGIPSDRWERVNALLTVPAGLARLRDDICHATWMASPLPNAIQPNWILQVHAGVEPAHPGPGTEEVSYTLEALAEIVANLADNHARLLDYLTEMKMI